MAPLLRLRGIQKTYALGKLQYHALRGVDFELIERDMCAFVGPSGSGKTTLLNIIGCLDTATEGTYELDGQLVAARDFDELAHIRSQKIGFVFQTFNLVPVLDVWENVELAAWCADKEKPQQVRARIEHLLQAVGLDQHMHHRPDELSGGQRQRVAIARALVSAPRLILADEPTANLDSETATAILELLVRLNQEEGVSVIFSTHDSRVLAYAKRKVQLRDGRVVSDSSAA